MTIKTDYRIPSALDGYTLLLRNKRLQQEEREGPRKTVLFVHGATYGSSDTFDYQMSGQSWMDHLAAQHFDVWCLDLLGYGQSDRPAQMDQPADANAPIVDTAHAIQEMDHAVSFIFDQRRIEKLDLIGYSWGTAICGGYAGQYPHNLDRLVLSGALWIEGMSPAGAPQESLGAYRTVDAESMLRRWSTALTKDEIDRIVSEDERRHWCRHTVSCDPTSAQTGLLRAPTGVMQDFMRCRDTGEDWYDPSLIVAPVQIVVGELDQETTPAQGQQLFSRLIAAKTKQLTVIGQGTHSLLLENNRHQLYRAVDGFLAGPAMA